LSGFEPDFMDLVMGFPFWG